MCARSICLALPLMLGSASTAMALPTLNTFIAGGYLEVVATNADDRSYTCVVQATYTADTDTRGTVLSFQVPPSVSNTAVASFGPLVDPQLKSALASCL